MQNFKQISVEDVFVGDYKTRITLVTIKDSKVLDEQKIEILGNELFALVDQQSRKKILLNFQNVEFYSSAALGKLITLHRKVKSVRGDLVFCSLSKEIMGILEITKLDKMFDIESDLPGGLKFFLG